MATERTKKWQRRFEFYPKDKTSRHIAITKTDETDPIQEAEEKYEQLEYGTNDEEIAAANMARIIQEKEDEKSAKESACGCAG